MRDLGVVEILGYVRGVLHLVQDRRHVFVNRLLGEIGSTTLRVSQISDPSLYLFPNLALYMIWQRDIEQHGERVL
jgi:hypothetical protein